MKKGVGIYLFFGLVLLPELLGLPYGRVITVLSVALISMPLLTIFLIKNKRVLRGWKFKVLLSVIILVLASVSQSEDLVNSVFIASELFVVLAVAILVWVYLKPSEKMIAWLLILLGSSLSLYSLFLNSAFTSLTPRDGYQAVFSRFGSHNHLGDFLILSLISTVFLFLKEYRKVYLFVFALLFGFFVFSYSRSAYMSFAVVIFAFAAFSIKRNISKGKKIGLFSVTALGILLSSIFFFATVFESALIPFAAPIHNKLVADFGLRFKHFGANRPEYFKTAINSAKEKPIFGVGPGNFRYASAKYTSIPGYTSHSSHNIFLDILSEYGIGLFLILLFLIMRSLSKSLKKPTLFSFLFIALLINFQTDYTFRIFSVALLFATFISIILKQDTYEI
jgi:O-antigen ligase